MPYETASVNGREPRLSIGMPVFNGENYLSAALESLLQQTFTDFEIIISDNASTDRTAEICQAYAERDPRVFYRRNPTNLGAAKNYNITVDLARGEFFKWAAHDDVCEPEFLRRCIEMLDADPRTVLCHTLSAKINEDGDVVGEYSMEVEATDESPQKRFWRLISTPHYCIPVFGVMRLDVLRRTPMHGNYVGADRMLLAELALLGKLRLVDEKLFARRDHPEASIRKYRNPRDRQEWFDPSLGKRAKRPQWGRLRGYASAVLRVPLPLREKAACMLHLVRWCGRRTPGGVLIANKLAKELFLPFR